MSACNKVMVSFDVESLCAVQAALRKLENDSDLANRTNLTPYTNCRPLEFRLEINIFPI